MRYNEDILVALAADCILWKESRSVYATELVMVHRGTGLGITGDSSTIASSLKKRLRMVRAVSKLAVSNTSPQLVTFPSASASFPVSVPCHCGTALASLCSPAVH